MTKTIIFKRTIIFFFIVVITIFFSACKNRNSTVKIGLNDTIFTASPLEVVTIQVTLTHDIANKGELGEFTVTDNQNFNKVYTFAGTNSVVFDINYTVPENSKNSAISLVFIATDGKSGKTSTETAIIQVGDPTCPQIILPISSLSAFPEDSITIPVTLVPSVSANNNSSIDFTVRDENNKMDTTFYGVCPIYFDVQYTVPEYATTSTIPLIFTAKDNETGATTSDTVFIKVYAPTPPEIILSPNSFTVKPGENININVTLVPDKANNGKLGNFYITDISGASIYSNYFSGSESVNFDIQYTVPADAGGSVLQLIFHAEEGNTGKYSTDTAIINVEYSIIIEDYNVKATYVSTSLENQMMYILNNDGVTTDGGTSTSGDLAFVWQSAYGYSICSPDAEWITMLFEANGLNYTTNDKKNTKIMKYNGNWDDLNDASINELSITSETLEGGGNGVQNLNEGDIVIFETSDGRKGALKVKTNAKITKNMIADFKYQEIGNSGK